MTSCSHVHDPRYHEALPVSSTGPLLLGVVAVGNRIDVAEIYPEPPTGDGLRPLGQLCGKGCVDQTDELRCEQLLARDAGEKPEFWKESNAEGMILLRSYLKAGRFDNLIDRSISLAASRWTHEHESPVAA